MDAHLSNLDFRLGISSTHFNITNFSNFLYCWTLLLGRRLPSGPLTALLFPTCPTPWLLPFLSQKAHCFLYLSSELFYSRTSLQSCLHKSSDYLRPSLWNSVVFHFLNTQTQKFAVWSIFSWGQFPPPPSRGHWQWLETFLALTMGRGCCNI